MADAERLRELFGEAGLRWVVDRLVSRLRGGRPLTGSIGRRDPRPEERRAVERLLGRPPGSGRVLTVRLDELERRLRHAGLARDLTEAVGLLVGVVEDRHARRRAQERRLRGLLAAAAARDPRAAVATWLEMRRTWVLLRRWGRDEGAARRLLDEALEVLARLPSDRGLLQELAVAVTGDAHALDPGRRLGTLIVPAVAALGGLGEDARDWHEALGRRDVWSSVGVVTDDLSMPVLVLGLPGDEASDLGRLLALHHRAGDPCRLSLRQLRRHDDALGRLLATTDLGTVFVCENPALVTAAADRLGARSAPLVCLEGQPATAARHLLDRLAGAGVVLRYQGDFDWPGIRIANLVMERHGALSWRFAAGDYLRHRAGPVLAGTPVAASWDPRLAPTMAARGRAVHEEALFDELLGDLARPPVPTPARR